MTPFSCIEHFPVNENLLCAHCGNTYLHHFKVDIFERSKEDSPDGLHVHFLSCDRLEINRNAVPFVAVDNLMGGNPSPRRGGVTIVFWCENCHGVSALHVYQHKGETFLDMHKV